MATYIDKLAYSGSAFGVNDKGEAVFINGRIVEKMDIQEGDTVVAHCIPNYPDKADQIPWRCIRVDVQDTITPDPEPKERTADEIDRAILEIIDHHHDCFLTTSEVAEDAKVSTTTAGNSLNRLFKKGLIAKADVYATAGQDRASWSIWAYSTDLFR
jgi:inorganic pyrophosphatase/exopolyphosphatase